MSIFVYFQFTVTKVDEDANSLSSGRSGERVGNGDHGGGGVSENGPLPQDAVVTLQVPDSGPSDGESSYGDTLTQTSITKLLSKKFKVSLLQHTKIYFKV